MRDSLECHQTSSRKVSCWDLAGGPYARGTIFSLLRVPQSFRIQTIFCLLLLPPPLRIYFYVSSFLHLSLSVSLFLKVVPRDRVLSVLEKQDTYRSVLFTTQSILRDVGVPISAVSALFFSVFDVLCLRIHIPSSCFIFRLLSTCIVFRRYLDSTSLSRYIIVKNSVFFSRHRSF